MASALPSWSTCNGIPAAPWARANDAEVAEPGIVWRTLDEKLEQGEEPTKAAAAILAGARTSPRR